MVATTDGTQLEFNRVHWPFQGEHTWPLPPGDIVQEMASAISSGKMCCVGGTSGKCCWHGLGAFKV